MEDSERERLKALETHFSHLVGRAEEDRELLHQMNENLIKLIGAVETLSKQMAEQRVSDEDHERRIAELEVWKIAVETKTNWLRYLVEGFCSAVVAVVSIVVWAGYFNKGR